MNISDYYKELLISYQNCFEEQIISESLGLDAGEYLVSYWS